MSILTKRPSKLQFIYDSQNFLAMKCSNILSKKFVSPNFSCRSLVYLAMVGGPDLRLDNENDKKVPTYWRCKMSFRGVVLVPVWRNYVIRMAFTLARVQSITIKNTKRMSWPPGCDPHMLVNPFLVLIYITISIFTSVRPTKLNKI